MATLSEIVSSALQQHDQGVKVASLREAPGVDRSFDRVDDYLARELGQLEVEPESTKQASAAEAEDTSTSLDDVRYALKLAEALDYGADIVEKIAIEGPLNKSTGGKPHSGSPPRGGPAAVLPHNYDNAKTQVPRPQASAHARAAQANRTMEDGHPKTDEHMQLNGGPVIPNGRVNGPSRTTGAQSKQASRAETQRLLQNKIAQHRMLVALGQTEAADAAFKEAADIAQNADLIFGDNYQAATFPDNEGVRNMTKAQARDRNQREASSFWGEPVKRDNAATTHLAVADGLKLSADDKVDRGSARLLGTTPIMPNVEKSDELTKNRDGKKVTKVARQLARKLAYESKGTGAAALMGPVGTLVAGDSHNRGRRFLGSAAGGYGGATVGGGIGAGLGRLAGGKGNSMAKLVGAGIGATLGGVGGSAAGNSIVAKRTAKEKRANAMIKAAFIGGLGARVAGGLAKGLDASQGLIAKIPGRAAGRVLEGTERAAGGLRGLGTTGNRVVGGATLGAGALGTAAVGRKVLGGGDRA